MKLGVLATLDDAADVLDRAGAITVPALTTSYVEGTAGWGWDDRRARLAAIWRGLETSGRAVELELEHATMLARRLWPALVRVVTDPGWRAARIAKLPEYARAALAHVERDGEQPSREDRRSLLVRNELSTAVLVHVRRSDGAIALVSWLRWCTPELAMDAATLSLDEAQAALDGPLGGALA